MKSKIPLFLTVFVVFFIVAVYNFDILSSVVTGWPSGKHFFGKFIFVTLVMLTLFSLAATFIIDWIRKAVFRRKR